MEINICRFVKGMFAENVLCPSKKHAYCLYSSVQSPSECLQMTCAMFRLELHGVEEDTVHTCGINLHSQRWIWNHGGRASVPVKPEAMCLTVSRLTDPLNLIPVSHAHTYM